MKLQIEFNEDDLRQAVITYLKEKDKHVLPQNVYFRIEREEGYSDRIFCTATVYSWG
jgi:Fe2+ or Zn2+ uptake regulation protein